MIKRIQSVIRRFAALPLRKKYMSIGLLGVVLIGYVGIFSAPAQFPEKQIVSIEAGTSLSSVADEFEAQRVVRSSFVYKALGMLFGGARGVLAGEYYFSDKSNLFAVAYRTANGVYGLDPVLVTIPEGTASYEMIPILETKLSQFDAGTFFKLAEPLEGQLFPDTYLFPPNTKARQVVEHMHGVHIERIQEIQDEVRAFGRPFDEVLVMASLIEKEARDPEDRRIISGILWKRIEIGMPLQVDAVFGYINGTEIFHPTHDDLEVESPYNTYQNRGLPPGPITNPGLDAILAAVTPVETEYLYYLTGRDGNMYYGATFEQHVANRRQYLD